MIVQSDEIMFQSGRSQPDPTSALQSQSGSTPLVTDSYIYKQRPLRAAVLIMQKLEFSICLYIAFRTIFTTESLAIIVISIPFQFQTCKEYTISDDQISSYCPEVDRFGIEAEIESTYFNQPLT